MCRLFAGAHLSHTSHCDKHFLGTAEFYSALIEEQRARYSVQVWETAWRISFKGVDEDEERHTHGSPSFQRNTLQETLHIHQTVINAPGIDANAVEFSCLLVCFAQSREYLVPHRKDIPEAVSTYLHRLVGKAMHLLQAEL